MHAIRYAAFGSLFVLSFAGCGSHQDGGAGSSDVVAPHVVTAPEPVPSNVAARVEGHFDAATKKITFRNVPITSAAGVSTQGFKLDAASLFSLNSTSGDFGGTAVCPSDGANVFCTDVQVTNTSSGSPLNDMPDVYVELYYIDGGASVANSDAPKTGYNPPLTNSIGQFYYGSINAGATGTKQWKFNTAAQADFTFKIDVLYTHQHTTVANAALASGAASVDACGVAGATQLLGPGGGNTDGFSSATFGFPISIYGLTKTTGIVSENGFLVTGTGVSTGANTGLPAAAFSVNSAAILPFWDDLSLGTVGQVCEVTTGSSPSRTHIITWENMDIVSTGATVEQMTFSAVIYEGTDQVDLVYLAPSAISGATRGSGATFGIQGPVSGAKASHAMGFNQARLSALAANYPQKYVLTGN
jgi:hypothetical protein